MMTSKGNWQNTVCVLRSLLLHVFTHTQVLSATYNILDILIFSKFLIHKKNIAIAIVWLFLQSQLNSWHCYVIMSYDLDYLTTKMSAGIKRSSIILNILIHFLIHYFCLRNSILSPIKLGWVDGIRRWSENEVGQRS